MFSTAAGRVLLVDRTSGEIAHELSVGAPSIASPVVVDGVLILGDCLGDLYAWDIADLSVDAAAAVDDAPRGLHRIDAGGVATDGSTSGTREGYLFGIADPA